MRTLASIRKINDIRPIPGADAIEVATVDGWDVVVKKGEFNIGELAIYFEIDSFLPIRPEFEFLRKSSFRTLNGVEGFRLKTVKLRGQISQGLLMPIESVANSRPDYGSLFIRDAEPKWFANMVDDTYSHLNLIGRQLVLLEEGLDVTELLGVIKWEPPLTTNLAGKAKGNFPSFIPKTDEERVQNCRRTIENKYADHTWEVTMKLDGSSFTAYWHDGVFGVCSRNLDLVESDENAFWIAARKHNLREKMEALGRNIAVQAELFGEGIQKNPEGIKGVDIAVFNVYDIARQTKLTPPDRYAIVAELGLSRIPVIEYEKDISGMTTADILAYADGPSLHAKHREGVVFKSHQNPNISFKAISNSWLLKNEQ